MQAIRTGALVNSDAPSVSTTEIETRRAARLTHTQYWLLNEILFVYSSNTAAFKHDAGNADH